MSSLSPFQPVPPICAQQELNNGLTKDASLSVDQLRIVMATDAENNVIAVAGEEPAEELSDSREEGSDDSDDIDGDVFLTPDADSMVCSVMISLAYMTCDDCI